MDEKQTHAMTDPQTACPRQLRAELLPERHRAQESKRNLLFREAITHVPQILAEKM